MSVHIRVVAPVVPTGLTQPSDYEGILGGGDRLSYVEIETGPASIECAFDAMLAAADVVACIIAAEAEGVDAVVIDCMEDPGLIPGRECVSIPVLGPCQTSMSLACTLGHRFSVLSVTPHMGLHFETAARLYGADTKYASTRSVDIPVLDLASDPDRLAAALLQAALRAVREDGADTLILGCTGMVGIAQRLRSDLEQAGARIPVIDPIPVTVRLAKLLAETGIAHSKAAYPTPARKEIRGFAGSALEKFGK